MLIVAGAAVLAAVTVAVWVWSCRVTGVDLREPKERIAKQAKTEKKEPRNPGTLIEGDGKPADIDGKWMQFRTADRSNIADDAENLVRSWESAKPEVQWKVDVGEGYAGATVRDGRVYMVDYDQEKREDVIRCMSLATGKDIWRYTYSVMIKRNHGMSRTVPAVTDKYVVGIGPKCHVHCLDAKTGELQWKMNMVEDFGTKVPPWYTGQCPLIDGDTVVLAPGGDPLMMRVNLETGEPVWKAPNPGGWGMTHTSVMPMDRPGGRQYVYCTTKGVVGVSADDGTLLWQYPDWRISIATVPSALIIDENRIFLSGGYNSGAMMIRLNGQGQDTEIEQLFKLSHTKFGAEQHTPILYKDHIYGIRPSGEMTCLDLEGNVVWASGKKKTFGLGPYLLADGLLFCVEGHKATLHMVEATPDGYEELGSMEALDGPDAWAPMALAGGRLIVRDLTEVVCLKLPKTGT